jgi:hypothetical protein
MRAIEAANRALMEKLKKVQSMKHTTDTVLLALTLVIGPDGGASVSGKDLRLLRTMSEQKYGQIN